MNKPLIIIGAGGHASVLTDILKKQNRTLIALVAPNMTSRTVFDGLKIFNEDEDVFKFPPEEIHLVNGLGALPKDSIRLDIFSKYSRKGYCFESVVDDHAMISSYAEILQGAQIMAGAVIQSGSKIGKNTIVNTNATVDHDCQIGNHNHIAPGVVLSGNITTESNVHIGTGAQIIQSVTIGKNAIIGAGATVTKDVLESEIVYPAKNFVKRGKG